MLHVILQLLLAVGPAEKSQVEDHVVRQVIETNFDFDETIVEDIFYVAERAEADPMILASVVNRESNGHRQATRYCAKWKRKEDGKRTCVKEKSCYTKCATRTFKDANGIIQSVWKNRLDVGLWQLRDAPSWSWVRWYRKNHDPSIPKKCAVQRECSREAMVHIVKYLKKRASYKNSRSCRKPLHIPEYQWIAYWNWCGSYNNHVKTAIRLWKEALAM